MTKRLPAAAAIAAATIAVAGCSSPTEPATQPTATTGTTAAPAPTPLGEVQVGDCLLNSELGTGKLYGVSMLTVVDCGTPDSAPVVVAGPYKTNIQRGGGATTPGIPYLGFPNMAFVAVDECSKLQGIQNPEKTLNYAFPDKATWDAGGHVIVCVDPSLATGTYLW